MSSSRLPHSPTEDTPTYTCPDCGQEAHAVVTANTVCTTLTAGGKYIGFEDTPTPQSPKTGAIPSQGDNSGAVQDDTIKSKVTGNPGEQDDKQLEEILKMPLLGCDIQEMADAIQAYVASAQIQLVSELEGHKKQYHFAAKGGDKYYINGEPVEAVPLSVLEHKKQELERLQ